MARELKPITSAGAEGRAAAKAGQARSTNPYPQSGPAQRDEWFEAYDDALSDRFREQKSKAGAKA